MNTNFFSAINDLGITGYLRLTIQPQENGEMVVTLLLENSQVKDKAVKQIEPLLLNGSIADLDNEFFKAIGEPIQKTNTLLLNLQAHEKSLEKAQKESQGEKTKLDAAKKEKDGKRKKFEEQMKKVDELEKQKKIGEAIGQLPDIKIFPEFEEEIKKKSQLLRSQHGTLSLFEDDPKNEKTLGGEAEITRDEEIEEKDEEEIKEEEDDEDPDSDL